MLEELIIFSTAGVAILALLLSPIAFILTITQQIRLRRMQQEIAALRRLLEERGFVAEQQNAPLATSNPASSAPDVAVLPLSPPGVTVSSLAAQNISGTAAPSTSSIPATAAPGTPATATPGISSLPLTAAAAVSSAASTPGATTSIPLPTAATAPGTTSIPLTGAPNATNIPLTTAAATPATTSTPLTTAATAPGTTSTPLTTAATAPGTATPSAATVPATSATGTPATEAAAASEPSGDNSWESFFLGNIFNKLGALAIIVSLFLFVKLAAPYVLFTPELKVAAGALAGLALVVGGLILLRRENMTAFAEVTVGTGFAALFITTYAGCFTLQVISENVAFTIGILLLAGLFSIALRARHLSLLALALIAGHANLYVQIENVSPTAIVIYLCMLNLAGLLGAFRCRLWMYLLNINLLLSILTLGLASLSISNTLLVLFVATLWALYAIFDMLNLVREGNDDASSQAPIPGGTLAYINFVLLSMFAIFLWKENATLLGTTLLSIAAGYGLVCYVRHLLGRSPVRSYQNLFFLTVILGTVFFTGDSPARAYWLTLEGLLVVLAVRQTRSTVACGWMLPFLILGTLVAFQQTGVFSDDLSSSVLANRGLFGSEVGPSEPLAERPFCLLGASAIVWAFSAFILSTLREESWQNWVRLLSLGAITAAYLLVFVELQAYFSRMIGGIPRSEREAHECYATLCLAFLYSLNTWVLWKSWQNRVCLWLSGITFAVGGFLLFCFSLAFSDTGMFPILNVRALAHSLALAVVYGYYQRQPGARLGLVAAIVGFLFVHAEAMNLAEILDLRSLTTIAWILYAAALIVLGISESRSHFTYSGIFVVGLALIRILVVDIATLPAIYKLAIFFVLGVTLMLLSYLYARYRKELANRPSQGVSD